MVINYAVSNLSALKSTFFAIAEQVFCASIPWLLFVQRYCSHALRFNAVASQFTSTAYLRFSMPLLCASMPFRCVSFADRGRAFCIENRRRSMPPPFIAVLAVTLHSQAIPSPNQSMPMRVIALSFYSFPSQRRSIQRRSRAGLRFSAPLPCFS